MAAVHPISDGWEEVPDDDTFSMVSAPSSEPDTVLIPLTQTESAAAPQQPAIPQSPHDVSTSPPSTPIGIPYVLPMAEAHSHSQLVMSGSSALFSITDLPPPYADIDAESFTLASDSDGNHHTRSIGPSRQDGKTTNNRTGIDPSELLCDLAMVESARSEVVRFTTTELAPVRARLGQQILEVCAKLGTQVEDLTVILSSYERAWDVANTIYIDPALEEWLHCVKQLLVAMQAETESVALQSLDMDKDVRNEVVDGKIEEFLQCFYVCLVDHSQKMDDFLPIMIGYAAPL